jgi:hypothetical protein
MEEPWTRAAQGLLRDPGSDPADATGQPAWGAPRIHGQLQKLGTEISQAAVSKYMVRRRKPPSQTKRTFLENHAKDIVSVDFFAVPTATFSRVKGLGIEQVVISARSPWQSPYVERLIGSIRRECLDHVIVLSEKQLRRLLRSYFAYCHGSRVPGVARSNSWRSGDTGRSGRGCLGYVRPPGCASGRIHAWISFQASGRMSDLTGPRRMPGGVEGRDGGATLRTVGWARNTDA